MKSARLSVTTAAGTREVSLADYIGPADEERTAVAANRWIKALRHLEVDGAPLRRRFTFRGDSLWWFTELYLHKTETIRDLFRVTAAVEQLVATERPTALAVTAGDRVVRGVTAQVARARAVPHAGAAGFGSDRARRIRLEIRAAGLTYAAMLSRIRARRARGGHSPVVAFVHRAFWKDEGGDGSAESYIGPVLNALVRRLPPDGLRYVSVGPRSNFSARRWWHPFGHLGAGEQTVEAFAPLRALRPSMTIWRRRHTFLRALLNSPALRQHAIVDGIDWWPAVREELAGVALLQWPWSARAMDEAGAALDALTPDVALTYAEAGGWGRAIVLEARRRGIKTVGLQHGFIYRHWLNYLHEPDEMQPDANERGFPLPDRTLLFDKYAAEHLEREGHFASQACMVTGSPRLDALVAAARALSLASVEAARQDAGAAAGQAVVLVVAKFREARHVLPALIDAVRGLPGVQLAIKTHPAETPDVYAPVVAGAGNVRVLDAAAPLAPLLAAARAVVTVNSTVALDAAVLGVPALVIGLPNNLSPFVEAGVMAGAAAAEIGAGLSRILYDQEFRQQLDARRSVFLARYGISSDGSATDRSADAVISLLGPS